jgi:hypothetical protein
MRPLLITCDLAVEREVQDLDSGNTVEARQ